MLLWNCVVATTTKWHMKHNKYTNKNINLHTCSAQLYITQPFGCCFCCYSVILLLQQKLHMINANRSNTSGQLEICSQMNPAQMSYEKSSFS